MVKNINDITINDYSLYEETGDISYLIKNPKLLVINSFVFKKKLISELSEVFQAAGTLLGGLDIEAMLMDDNYFLHLISKKLEMANLSMLILLHINTKSVVYKDELGRKAIAVTDLNAKQRELFKEECHRDFTGSMADHESFVKRLEFWTDKFEQEAALRAMEREQSGGTSKTIAATIPYIEKVVGSINRDYPLLTLKYYIDAANAINNPKTN